MPLNQTNKTKVESLLIENNTFRKNQSITIPNNILQDSMKPILRNF